MSLEVNPNLDYHKPSDFKEGRLCTLRQRLLLKALIMSEWDTKKAFALNYNPGEITFTYYYKVLEAHRICLKLRKII